jgi:hypothetical protein
MSIGSGEGGIRKLVAVVVSSGGGAVVEGDGGCTSCDGGDRSLVGESEVVREELWSGQ